MPAQTKRVSGRKEESAAKQKRTMLIVAGAVIGILVLVVGIVLIFRPADQGPVTQWLWDDPTVIGTNAWRPTVEHELIANTRNYQQYTFYVALDAMDKDAGVGIRGQQCNLHPGQEIKVRVENTWYAIGKLISYELGVSATIDMYKDPVITTPPPSC